MNCLREMTKGHRKRTEEFEREREREEEKAGR